MVNKYQEVKEILRKYKQNHVIRYLEDSNDEIKNKLVEQILRIDFEELKQLYEKTFEEIYVDLEEMQPITGVNPDRLSKDRVQELENIGIDIIKNNKFALATMAGGQGTRLGHCMPKGTYKIEFETGEKYLFEIIVDTLQRANRKYNVTIPWYIMTSKENNSDTVDFLEEKSYFRIPKRIHIYF